MKCTCVHVHAKSECLTACVVANISKIRISVSVLPLVMSFVCVEHKARFQSFPSPLHWVYVYIKLCVCLLLAFQCLYVYQCVTSMYVLKYMARSMCVCVCVCVCRCVAQEDMHCTWSGPPSSSSEESGELQDSSVSPSPPSPRRAYKGQIIEKLSV